MHPNLVKRAQLRPPKQGDVEGHSSRSRMQRFGWGFGSSVLTACVYGYIDHSMGVDGHGQLSPNEARHWKYQRNRSGHDQ